MQQYTENRITRPQTRCYCSKLSAMKAYLLMGALPLLFELFFSPAGVIQLVSIEIWTWVNFVLDMNNQVVQSRAGAVLYWRTDF